MIADWCSHLCCPRHRCQCGSLRLVSGAPAGTSGHSLPLILFPTRVGTLSICTRIPPASFFECEFLQDARKRPQLLAEHLREVASCRDLAAAAFYDHALITPPLITSPITSLIVAGAFREKDFISSSDAVSHSVSLYAFCPADPTALAYDSVITGINAAALEAALGTSMGHSHSIELGRVNVVRSLQCVQTALLNFASLA